MTGSGVSLPVGPSHPVGSTAEVHVWLAPLKEPGPHESSLLASLSAAELCRARSAPSGVFRDRFIHCRAALRDLLSRYLQIAPSEVPIALNDSGRPSLAPPLCGALDFNLSHTDRWAVFAFGWGRRVGIDLEPVDRRVEWRSIAPRSFSALERRQLEGASDAAGARAFLRGWLRKEAYAKARGDGFAYGFSDFSVSLEDRIQGSALLEDRRDPHAVGRWWIRDLSLGVPLAAALAGDGPCETVRCWRYAPGIAREISPAGMVR
jgi:4'-phosphopantetheinyl transferase